MKLKTAKNTGLALLIAGFFCALYGQLMTEAGSSERLAVSIAMIIFMAGGLAVIFIWAKCPHCGKLIFNNLINEQRCPRCHKYLYEGKIKVKHK